MHIFETEEGILWDINHVYGNIYPAIAYISLFRIHTFFCLLSEGTFMAWQSTANIAAL